MKTMKKLFALLLALTMVFGLAATAFAADTAAEAPTGKITIKNPVLNEKYNIYQIATLSYEASEDAAAAYCYKLNEEWIPFIAKTYTIGEAEVKVADYLTYDAATGILTFTKENGDASKDSDDSKMVAKLIEAYINENSKTLEIAAEQKTGEAGETEGTTKDIEWELEYGWYFVTTTTGTICSLDTNAPSVEIEEKNKKPTIDKTVEDDDGEQADSNTAGVGDTVKFTVEISAKPGAKNYVLHESMTEGLTFDGADSVTITAKTGETNAVEVEDFEVVTENLCTSNAEDTNAKDCDFHIVFDQDYLDTITADTTITVTYTATVNEKAVIGNTDPVNLNDVQLTYGQNSHTEWDETKTYVYELNIWKYTKGNENKEIPLAGADFVLYRLNEEGNLEFLKATEKKDASNDRVSQTWTVSGWTTPATEPTMTTGANPVIDWTETEVDANATHFVTDDTGWLFIEGLDAGTYYLKETEAPTGYNLIVDATTITITEDENTHAGNFNGTQTALDPTDSESATAPAIKVENNSGTELPSTGGMGTTLFYIVGSLLVLGAAVTLVAKKRTNI